MKNLSEFEKKDKLYPDIEQIDSHVLVGRTIEIQEVKFLPSTFGGEFAVLKINLPEGTRTCSMGSKAIVEKLKKFQAELPFCAKVVEHKSKEGRKYLSLE